MGGARKAARVVTVSLALQVDDHPLLVTTLRAAASPRLHSDRVEEHLALYAKQ